ncbi:uncharacterized protein ARMOST_19105 [Armillaria ostoyae]|uniref:Uncharacterized protein n=1 Tax=Armillaria ostoyae TaxID=47428 RepID=A0A284S3L7_ARMOS|nr:uncharacterized protein ARMOST_19105 [Armillaria ostoyae]
MARSLSLPEFRCEGEFYDMIRATFLEPQLLLCYRSYSEVYVVIIKLNSQCADRSDVFRLSVEFNIMQLDNEMPLRRTDSPHPQIH